jgi:hypothetical protein
MNYKISRYFFLFPAAVFAILAGAIEASNPESLP